MAKLTQTKRLELANRIIALYAALNSVVGAWIVPLIDPALQRQPELRNRLFCLMMCGMTDAGWEYKTRINALRKQVPTSGTAASAYYLDVAEKYLALAVDLLEQISREEMIEITELRIQWLHGSWTELFKETRTVYFAKGGHIVRQRISAEEYNAISRLSGPPDEFIAPIRDRVEQYRTFFWSVDRALANREVYERVHQGILSGAVSGTLTLPDPRFRPDPTTNTAFFRLVDLWGIVGVSLGDRST